MTVLLFLIKVFGIVAVIVFLFWLLKVYFKVKWLENVFDNWFKK